VRGFNLTYGKAAKFYDLFGEKPDVEFYKGRSIDRQVKAHREKSANGV